MEDKVDRKNNPRKKYKKPGVKRVRLDGGSVRGGGKPPAEPSCCSGGIKA